MTQRLLYYWSTRIGTLMLGVALLLAGCDSSGSDPPEEDTGAEVSVATNDSMGTYLADVDGVSLYLFTDTEGNPVSCTGQCAEAWPPLITDGEPVASGSADESLLGTTERSDGSTQVTYNGWPLYYFVNDEGPGDVNGQGIESFGGIWYLVTPTGNAVQNSSGNDGDGGDDGGDGPAY